MIGAGQSDLYQGTYGDNPDNIPDELKGKVRMPQNDSQIKHIMREDEGHLIDTPENRRLLIELANNSSAHIGKDSRGIDWHVSYNEDGSQNWVCHRDGVIQDGGRNMIPREFDEETGLKNNAKKDNSWRKKP